GKGRGLDLGITAGRQTIDEGDLVVRLDELLFVLKTVAGRDLLDVQPFTACLHVQIPRLASVNDRDQARPRARQSASVAASRPSAPSTSAVCSPRPGAGLRISPGVALSLGTMPGTLIGVPSGKLASRIMPRAW